MVSAALSIVAGLVLLAAGAEALVRGSSSIALRLGITPLVIGLTIVAFGTGSPEMIVSLQAALSGNSGIALGNIVGSNISNIAMILGLSALARPLVVRSVLLKRETPLMIAVTVLLCVLLLDGELGRLDGFILVSCAIAYTTTTFVAAQRDRDAKVAAEFAQELSPPQRSGWISGALVGIGLAALLLGAGLLVEGAVVVAEFFGMSQVVIGLTVVAIGTSLPELATSLVAALRGDADVAFGNVIGSNILNILLILGVVALIQPISSAGLRGFDLAALVLSAVMLYPLMLRGAILNRWEGAVLLVSYVAYIGSLLI